MLSADEIFARLLELEPQEQEKFLRLSCQGDAALKAEVVSLLKAFPEAETFFNKAWLELWADSEPTPSTDK